MIEPSLQSKLRHIYNLTTLYVCGFCLSFSACCFWLIIPILMRDIGASPFEIGFVGAVAFGAQGIFAPICGKLSDKIPAETLAIFGSLLHCLTCLVVGLLYIHVTSVLPLYFILIIQSAGFALFWSPTESMVGNEAFPGHESKNIGHFFMFCSGGKAIGFFSAGSLKALIGTTGTLYVSCLIGFIPFFVMTRFPLVNNIKTKENVKDIEIELESSANVTAQKEIENQSTNMTQEELNSSKEEVISEISNNQINEGAIINDSSKILDEEKEEGINIKDIKTIQFLSKRPTHYFLYYINDIILHLVIYGTVGIIQNQYVNLASDKQTHLPGFSDNSDVYVGILLFVINIAQLVAFFILGFFKAWQFKITLNIISLLISMICLTGFLFINNGYILCTFGIIFGFIAGFDLEENMFYSLNASEKEKGKYMGISECSSCLSYSLSPLIAGVLSTLLTTEWCIYSSMIFVLIGLIGCGTTQAYVKWIEYKEKKMIEKETGKTNQQLKKEFKLLN
ncbi:transporter, major facilitator family protein [Entamoeba histolytica HM-1:IMSS-B]|uniref:Transporter, major facilitator family n=6 Tax=Entamoeba histolytica TaxID=5759 RepID=C4M4C3_ENTH1|nr:transporter, major facilitator family [Entamoeba histolytica HM-1:IMSS]EMD44950.1 transporter major facilitator family protein, putative [Entamoeba histolytica KU27]EMH77706.1 transporter, major facilitator family protein [Entamoeba histolytica HM-1:IMSS-B]EMS15333.1 transporter, major facilitator family protein [Entamoeba histolytica HM-3:IMSS]ENY63629.1 transporter, major facilitator family protein, putative [Entamoeba histolytica HM-1:IMSS-A]GAT96214.1 transporter major facilitator famil|eukprot:XP_652911.1 transporter, major facilitator family [Entamoeba histolytica HM-1:IMSS]